MNLAIDTLRDFRFYRAKLVVASSLSFRQPGDKKKSTQLRIAR